MYGRLGDAVQEAGDLVLRCDRDEGREGPVAVLGEGGLDRRGGERPGSVERAGRVGHQEDLPVRFDQSLRVHVVEDGEDAEFSGPLGDRPAGRMEL